MNGKQRIGLMIKRRGKRVMKGHHRPLRATILAAVVVWPLLTSLPAGDALARPAGQTTWCPSGWTCQDVGTPTSGSQTQSGTTWNVTAGGAFAGNYDWYHFLWQPLPASGMVSTVVKSIGDGGNLNGGAGVIIRPDSTDAQAPYYTAVVRQRWAGGWQVQVLYRPNQGANEITLVSTGQVTLPIGLEVMRTGVTYTAYLSTGGTGAYTLIAGSKFMLTMPGRLRAGLVVASGSDPRTITVGLDAASSQVTLQDPTPIESCPSDWTCTTVDEANDPTPPSLEGESTYMEQSWATEGSGWGLAGAWGDGSDQFRYIYHPYSGGNFSAHVAQHINGGAPWDDVGLMIRQSTNGKSPYYMAGVETDTSGNMTNFAIRIWYRSTQGGGGGIVSTVRGLPTTPWLSITDNGGVFSTSYSLDGSSWQPVPNSTPTPDPNHPWDGSGLAGMASMGHSETAGFGSVEIPSAGSPVVSREVGSPSEPATTLCAGEGVDCDTGWLWDSGDDLSDDDDSDMPLNFDDTYMSGDAGQDGPLGLGWAANYAMFLSMDSSGAITVHEEAGTAVTFFPSAGTYQAPPRVLAALTDNGNGTMTFTRRDRVSYLFSTPTQTSPGNLLSKTNADGYSANLNYDGGKLTSVTNSAGDSLTFSYADTSSANVNHITSITDSSNRTVRFGYDAAGELTDIYDVGRADTGIGHTVLAYDANHRMVSRTDPAGHQTTYTYDAQGRVHQQTVVMAAGNRTTQWDYTTNPDGSQQTTVTDPNGHVTVETYVNHELTAETDGYGSATPSTWQYTYDPDTRELTSMTDPAGSRWTQKWDSRGNLLQSIGPNTPGSSQTNLETTSYQYTPENSLFFSQLVVTTPSGHATTYALDQDGDPLSVSRTMTETGTVATTSFSYGDSAHPGRVTAVTDPNLHTTSFAYDSAGRLIRSTDPSGDATTYGYDTAGRLLWTVTPKGNLPGADPTRYMLTNTYDPAGDLTTSTDQLGDQQTYHYDADGQVISSTDPLSTTTSYQYDEAGELTKAVRPDGSSIALAYDGNGNLLSQNVLSAANVALRTITYSYDAQDRMTATVDPSGHQTTYGYDSRGNLVSIQDAANQTTQFAYNELDSLMNVHYSDPSTAAVSFGYNADGQRVSMTDGTGTTTYAYDSLGRLASVVDGAAHQTNYSYDPAGNMTSMTYPSFLSSDRPVVNYRYDASDRLTDVIDWIGSGNDTHFNYDANGNLTGEDFPSSTNGAKAAMTYDTADELESITASRTSGAHPFRWIFGYGRNANGNVTAATDRLAGVRRAYTYDTLGRLTSDQASNRTGTAWTYDAAGNIQTARPTGAATQVYCYDSGHTELLVIAAGSCTSQQGTSFQYNADGARTGATDLATGSSIATYSYNQENELVGLTRGGTNASYTYDGDGLRMSKTVNGASQTFAWDVNQDTPQIIQDSSMRYITGPDGLPVEQIDSNNNVQYFVLDHLGSTRALLNSDGSIAGTYTYSTFGAVTSHTGSATTPLTFAGQYADTESNLGYANARYYDPSSQSFLTVDPLLDATLDPYGYAQDNPVNLADPNGDCPSAAEPVVWEADAGSCHVAITGIGYDKQGRAHYNIRVWKGKPRNTRQPGRFNWHVSLAALDNSGLLKWDTTLVRRRGTRRKTYSGKSSRHSPQRQAHDAANDFASDIQKQIKGVCGDNDIASKLMQKSNKFPDGVLPHVLYDLYKNMQNNAVSPGPCPIPQLGCN
jgi:RHS repeat-associated protein